MNNLDNTSVFFNNCMFICSISQDTIRLHNFMACTEHSFVGHKVFPLFPFVLVKKILDAN